MDPQVWEMSSIANGFESEDGEYFLDYGQSEYFSNGIKHDWQLDSVDIPFYSLSPGPQSFPQSSPVSSNNGSRGDQDSDEVLKFLNEILVEEHMEEKPSMFHDPLALRATEKSLYETIGQKYPPSPYNAVDCVDQQSDSPESIFATSSEYTSSSNAGSISVDREWILEPGEYYSAMEQAHHTQDFSDNTSLQEISQPSSFFINSSHSQDHGSPNTLFHSFDEKNLFQNMFSNSESILQFQKGMEEASKFLPTNNQLIIDLDKYELPQKSEHIPRAAEVKVEKVEIHESNNGLRRRKYEYSENGYSDSMERGSKQSAVHVEDDELCEMMDRVLLCPVAKGGSGFCGGYDNLADAEAKVLVPDVLPDGSSGRSRAKKNESNGDTVDLRSVLISCAQSVAADDRKTAYEQLNQISQHSSPTGDVNQRLGNVFANGLQARLGGTGTELYASLARKRITACQKLKAYQVYLSACPFKKLSIFFANKMILLAALGASTLHIIDFGILYGFQWPVLIQHLSERLGGPPKLRITGIEFPQPGFRPAEQIEETGCRLARYCERFGVPFEYRAIATKNWEMIKLEDLKIVSGEVLAVNCFFRLGRMLDETVVVDSPRDALLNLIRKMKPDIFVNAVTNGSYSAPFFATRFREALFHYSALFDMFDATIPRDNPHRIDFEQDFFGREVINVIACEGAERVERPETYKQWQVRHMRAGFKPLPLNRELLKKLKHKLGSGYHKDFLFDEDGGWLLQGWKGRIICGSSCWVAS